MDKIVNLDNVEDFDFSKLSLLQPSALQGGSYFTKLRYYGEPLYFQSPKLFTRNGIVETNKTNYIDLLFTNENESFIAWLENLETHIHQLIYEKRNLWFNNELELSDIESAFTSSIKPYKGGKFFLVRSNILKNKLYNSAKPSCLIFDEHENTLTTNDITNETKLITIIDVQGVKFSSKNFQIELVTKQLMVINNKYEFGSCVIKVNKPSVQDNQSLKQIETSEQLEKNDTIQSEEIYENSNIKDTIDVTDISNSSNNLDITETKDNTLYEKHSNVGVDNNDNKKETTDEVKIENNNTDIEKNIIVEKSNTNTLEKSDAEDLEKSTLENKDNQHTENTVLKEIELKPDQNMDTMTLKKPNDVYYEIYKIAKEKAKNAKKKALEAYLELKKIKNTYLLTDLDESDSDSEFLEDSDYSENDSDSEEDLENTLEIEKLESI